MNKLKEIHPYLYLRVKVKGITAIALGASLIFSDWLARKHIIDSNHPPISEYLSYDILGAIFIVLGAGVIYTSILNPKRNYRMTKVFLHALFLYALFWAFVLIVSTITGRPRTSAVMILWLYYTYNLHLIVQDTGWKAVELVKQIKELR